MAAPAALSDGRFLGPTTATGLAWRRRMGELAGGIGGAASLIAWLVFGNILGIVGLVTLTLMILVWEVGWRVAERRKLGYFAYLDD